MVISHLLMEKKQKVIIINFRFIMNKNQKNWLGKYINK